MSLARLRAGEWLVAGGLVALLATLFLDWFRADARQFCRTGERALSGEACDTLTSGPGGFVVVFPARGWGALGHPWLELLGLFALGLVVVLVLALRAGPGRPTYGAMVSVVLTGAFGLLVLVLTLIRVVLARPDAVLPSFADSPPVRIEPGLAVGTWIGLAALVVALAGLWVAMADDRPDAQDSRFDPPPPRPVPAPKPDGSAGPPAVG